jgi:hypothetical protein
MKGSTKQLGGIPCPGCPIYSHIPDEQFRFPSCELCHWPAIGVGSTHVWRCAYCRHWNEHGLLRPRVSAVLLRLADTDPAARQLAIADARYGRYLLPPSRPSPRSRTPGRPEPGPLPGVTGWTAGPTRPNRIGAPRWTAAPGRATLPWLETAPGRAAPARTAVPDRVSMPARVAGPDRVAVPARVAGADQVAVPARVAAPGRRRVAGPERAGRPVYARATVAGLPVLIVGGDRPYPYPLGLAEDDPEPCAFGSRATRIACPCAQIAPCLHGQALYAHVVAPIVAPPLPAGTAPCAATLSRCAC